MGFVDKWPSWMQGQWFFPKTGWACKISRSDPRNIHFFAGLPMPISTFPKKLVRGRFNVPPRYCRLPEDSNLDLQKNLTSLWLSFLPCQSLAERVIFCRVDYYKLVWVRVRGTFELNQRKSASSQFLPFFSGFDRLQTCCHSFGPANILHFIFKCRLISSHCNENQPRTLALISKPVFQCSKIMKRNNEAKTSHLGHSPNRYKPMTDT
jgi:hypothetical protein